MADQNPFQQFGTLNENDQRAQIYNMRIMHMADQVSPSMRTRFAGGRGGMDQNPMMASMLSGQAGTPDYSQFTYDPQARQAAQQYLGQYGLSPVAPQNVQHNAVLPNTGFFANHPRLSGMLEGGLFGAAATRGSDTWGEGISNVAGGLLEGHLARQGMINRQFAKPFQAANMMEGMEDRAAERRVRESTLNLQESEIQYHRAMAQKAGLPEHEYAPLPGTGSPGDRTIGMYNKNDGSVLNRPNPNYNPAYKTKSATPWEAVQAAHPDETVDQQIKRLHADEQPPQRSQQSLAVGADGKVYEIRPGMTLPQGTTLLNQSGAVGGMTPQQKEAVKPIDDQIKQLNSKTFSDQIRMQFLGDAKWMKAHSKTFGVDLKSEVEKAKKVKMDQLSQQRQQILNPNPMGGGESQGNVLGTYDPNTGTIVQH